MSDIDPSIKYTNEYKGIYYASHIFRVTPNSVFYCYPMHSTRFLQQKFL